MFVPWIFGDEYLYLSKARNIQRGIDVLADVSQGHTYPPLYSYLLSLVMGTDPLISYQHAQWLNVGVSQLLIIISLLILYRVFRWTDSKKGWVYLLLLYFAVATSTMITGFYFVAMSENLYTPLVILIFSLVVYISKSTKLLIKQTWLLVGTVGILCGLAVLTRTIGYVLLPSVAMSLLVIGKPRKIQLKYKILLALVVGLIAIGAIQTFQLWEASQVVRTELQQTHYEELSSGYLGVLQAFLTGEGNWFVAFKILGNHLTYLLFASFFFPVLFLMNDVVKMVKTKKLDAMTIFVCMFGLGSLAFSFLHCYWGFQTEPIKYSTYFRYFDQAILIFILYGLIRLWQWVQKKEQINKLAVLLFGIVSLVGLVFLPPRDFYMTLNSFGWAWLDLFINNQWMIRVVGFALIVLSSMLVWKKQLYPLLLVVIIGFQVASIPTISKMHEWLSHDFKALVEPVRRVAVDQGITNWYITSDYQEKGMLGDLYFIKYLLLFYGNEFEPVKVVDQKQSESITHSTFVKIDQNQLGDIVILKNSIDN